MSLRAHGLSSMSSPTALANILETIENMGALAKDELASQMRGLLHRYIRVESEQNGGIVPHRIPHLSQAQAHHLLTQIGNGNTGTTGILEQRLVDCFGLTQHAAAGWASKGIGDSVFAANTYRKKLGDIEFEQPERPNPQSVSYESHGGHLTAPYVQDHLDSFKYVLSVRRDELEIIAPLADWTFEVVFVAHTFEAALPANATLLGTNVVLRYVTFAAAAATLAAGATANLVNEHLVDRLNSGFVHPNVRQRALELIH